MRALLCTFTLFWLLQAASSQSNDCEYSNDGVCDVPALCDSGTDCTDCSTCGSAPTTRAPTTPTTTRRRAPTTPTTTRRRAPCLDEPDDDYHRRRGSPTSEHDYYFRRRAPPSHIDNDSCQYANDGHCATGSQSCAFGTDCTDCGTCGTTRRRASPLCGSSGSGDVGDEDISAEAMLFMIVIAAFAVLGLLTGAAYFSKNGGNCEEHITPDMVMDMIPIVGQIKAIIYGVGYGLMFIYGCVVVVPKRDPNWIMTPIFGMGLCLIDFFLMVGGGCITTAIRKALGEGRESGPLSKSETHENCGFFRYIQFYGSGDDGNSPGVETQM